MYAAFTKGVFDGFFKGTAPKINGVHTTFINLAPSQGQYVNSLPEQQRNQLQATVEKNGALRLHF